jgi:hypothetical protein
MSSAPVQQKAGFTLTILYFALLGSTFIYVFIAFFLLRTGWHPAIDPKVAKLLGGVFLAIALMLAVMISVIKKRFFVDSLPDPSSQQELRRYVVSKSVMLFALSEVPAILGFVYFLLAGSFKMLLVYWAISLISFAIAKPSNDLIRRIDS